MISLTIKSVFILGILTILFVPGIFAQGASGGAPYGRGGSSDGAPYGPGKSPNEGEKVPIDGGAVLLLAAGAAYGIKKIKEHRVNGKNSSL